MARSITSRRYAEVRRDENSITTRVNLAAKAGDDLLRPGSWGRVSFDVFAAMVDTSRDARLVLAHLMRHMELDKCHFALSCVEIAEALDLSRPRVSKAAKELRELGLARYEARGKKWEIEPTLMQFGNVLRDPDFAAWMRLQRADDEVPFPTDDATRANGQEPVRVDGVDAMTDVTKQKEA